MGGGSDFCGGFFHVLGGQGGRFGPKMAIFGPKMAIFWKFRLGGAVGGGADVFWGPRFLGGQPQPPVQVCLSRFCSSSPIRQILQVYFVQTSLGPPAAL